MSTTASDSRLTLFMDQLRELVGDEEFFDKGICFKYNKKFSRNLVEASFNVYLQECIRRKFYPPLGRVRNNSKESYQYFFDDTNGDIVSSSKKVKLVSKKNNNSHKFSKSEKLSSDSLKVKKYSLVTAKKYFDLLKLVAPINKFFSLTDYAAAVCEKADRKVIEKTVLIQIGLYCRDGLDPNFIRKKCPRSGGGTQYVYKIITNRQESGGKEERVEAQAVLSLKSTMTEDAFNAFKSSWDQGQFDDPESKQQGRDSSASTRKTKSGALSRPRPYTCFQCTKTSHFSANFCQWCGEASGVETVARVERGADIKLVAPRDVIDSGGVAQFILSNLQLHISDIETNELSDDKGNLRKSFLATVKVRGGSSD